MPFGDLGGHCGAGKPTAAIIGREASVVVESSVSMLLNWSSSSTTTEKVVPAVVELGGAVA